MLFVVVVVVVVSSSVVVVVVVISNVKEEAVVVRARSTKAMLPDLNIFYTQNPREEKKLSLFSRKKKGRLFSYSPKKTKKGLLFRVFGFKKKKEYGPYGFVCAQPIKYSPPYIKTRSRSFHFQSLFLKSPRALGSR